MTIIQQIVIDGLIAHFRNRLRELGRRGERATPECKNLRKRIKLLEKP